MSMKLRAVVFRPEHTNDIFTIKKKMMVNDKMFTRGNGNYMLDDDHFQITTEKPWWRAWGIFGKTYFTTYYYAQGQPNPLPVPLFKVEGKKGLPADEELKAMFEAWLWRTIAAPARDVWDQLQFYMSAGTLVGIAYLCYMTYQGHADASTAGDAVSATTSTLPPPGP